MKSKCSSIFQIAYFLLYQIQYQILLCSHEEVCENAVYHSQVWNDGHPESGSGASQLANVNLRKLAS